MHKLLHLLFINTIWVKFRITVSPYIIEIKEKNIEYFNTYFYEENDINIPKKCC